jgi:hypothetical protein
MSAAPEKYNPELDEPQWAIFSDRGKASVILGENITKAIANWRKQRGRGSGEPIGIIRMGYGATFPGSYRNTDLFGVVCCVHTPPENGQKGPHS